MLYLNANHINCCSFIANASRFLFTIHSHETLESLQSKNAGRREIFIFIGICINNDDNSLLVLFVTSALDIDEIEIELFKLKSEFGLLK